MGLSSAASETQDFVTAAGIVIGGVFTYLKFFKDRIYRPRAELGVTAGYMDVGDKRYLHCAASVKNIGTSKLSLRHEGTCLYVRADRGDSELLRRMDWVDPVGRPTVLDIFADHDWIESSEAIQDEAAVRIPNAEDHAYWVRLRLVVANPSPFRRGNIELNTYKVVNGNQPFPSP
jgi:hypothetical protein